LTGTGTGTAYGCGTGTYSYIEKIHSNNVTNIKNEREMKIIFTG